MEDSARTDPGDRRLSASEVLADRDVRVMLFANLAFSTGIMVQAAAVYKQVFDITGDELDIGLLGLAEFLPAFLLVFVTGAVADRFDRRRVGSIALVGEALCALALMLYSRTDPTATWPIFLIAVFVGASRGFMQPSTRAIPPMVAPPGGLSRVIALYSATWTAAMIIGPITAGFLYAESPSTAYAAAALLVGLGAVSLSTLRLRVMPVEEPSDDDRPTLRSAFEGLAFIRRTPILFAAISLDLFAVLFGAAVALLPAIAEDRLGVGDVAYGWLRAAPGIGAATMALVLAVRPVHRHVGRRLLWSVGVFGLCTVALGVTTNYVVAFIALVVLAGADMISVFIRATLVPLVTPDSKRGRVLAVENVFIGASNELGAFRGGVLARLVGTQLAVIGGGIATLGIVGFWWFRFTELRDVDRFEDLERRPS